MIFPCDVSKDVDIVNFFEAVEERFGTIDFVVHSLAYAPTEDLKLSTVAVSREGFKNAMDISVYSMLSICHQASRLMSEGGSIVGMTYYGGEKVMPGYNIMGVCKAALDASVKYAAYELGPKAIRVNAISAGPVRTLAHQQSVTLKMLNSCRTWLLGSEHRRRRCCTSLRLFASDMSKMITGEILHVDSGFIMDSLSIETQRNFSLLVLVRGELFTPKNNFPLSTRQPSFYNLLNEEHPP